MTRRVSNPLLADQTTTALPRQMLPVLPTLSFVDPCVGKFPNSTGKTADDGKLTGKIHYTNRQDKDNNRLFLALNYLIPGKSSGGYQLQKFADPLNFFWMKE